MWKLSFVVTLWTIWKERNVRHFEGKSSSVDSLPEKVKLLVALWVSPHPLFHDFSIDSIMVNWKGMRFWSCSIWLPPPVAHFKLDFDGSVDGNPGLAGIGEVIHDSNSSSECGLIIQAQ